MRVRPIITCQDCHQRLPHNARGRCSTCYKRQLRTGAFPPPTKRQPTQDEQNTVSLVCGLAIRAAMRGDPRPGATALKATYQRGVTNHPPTTSPTQPSTTT